jgi:hypothetical protein
MKNEAGEIYKDRLGKKWWIDNFLRDNFNYIMPRVSHKTPHRRSDMFIIVDGPVGCLTGDTIISTSLGPQKLFDVASKEVYLKSYDFENNKEILGKGVVIPSGVKEVFEIETEDGRKVKATAEHKFFVLIKEEKVVEVELQNLKEGDELICDEKSTVRIKLITKLESKEETFDLTVYPTGNFFLKNGLLSHNSGKSTLSFQAALYFDKTFNLDRVVFSVDDFLTALINASPGQAVVFDEAIIVNSRSALTEFNKKVIIAMTQIRSKGLYIFFNIPSVFDLDRNLVLNRCHLLLHCYQDHFGDRGRYCVFDKDKMKMLYLKGKRLYTYAFPKANFVGAFSEYFYLDREDYENKKQREIAAQAKGKKINKWEQRFKRTVRKLCEKESNFFVGVTKEEKRLQILRMNQDMTDSEMSEILYRKKDGEMGGRNEESSIPELDT